MNFSKAAWRIWAKKLDEPPLWMPLAIHILDCIDVAERLWENWLSDGVKLKLAQPLNSIEAAKKVFIFLAASHDIGKVTAVFQSKPSLPVAKPIDDILIEQLRLVGLDTPVFNELKNPERSHHAFTGEVLLLLRGCPVAVAAVVGSHHGKPSDFGKYDEKQYFNDYEQHYIGTQKYSKAWINVQNEFVDFALKKAGYEKLSDLPEITQEAQMLYCGLLIMTDWIASNTNYYPLFDLDKDVSRINLECRHQLAWEKLNLPFGYSNSHFCVDSTLWKKRFEFEEANYLQRKVLDISLKMGGGLMVIEAPMGSGKTEAALLAAEIFMTQQQRTGAFFALPTQATSDGIFPRFENWLKKLDDEKHSFQLSHGKAQFNKKYMALERLGGGYGVAIDDPDYYADSSREGSFAKETENGAVVHTWFEGGKKALLADFVVGTIDQLLMVSLKQKHVMLRHLGVANKVVIIDECHAYDAYMSHYLHRVLHWLGAYEVPVIVLSATLPTEKRKMLVTQYLGIPRKKAKKLHDKWTESEDYPLITYTIGKEVFQEPVEDDKGTEKEISIIPIDEEFIEKNVAEWKKNGACIGIIVNTVKRAQAIAGRLWNDYGENVELIHSSFIAATRIKKEHRLLSLLGKKGERPYFLIVVGTQVLEQSLDIDFDVIITDLCPMDLLLQRIGRLHRHDRSRPKGMEAPVFYVLNTEELEPGAKSIYGELLLERTKAVLRRRSSICLPNDIASLVQRVYNIDEDLLPETDEYKRMKTDFLNRINMQENKASAYRIPNIQSSSTIHGLLRRSLVVHGEPKVRDTESSIEVILVQRTRQGFNLAGDDKRFSATKVPEPEYAKLIARQSIRLPNALCYTWNIEQTIKELESQTMTYLKAWQDSPWLKGELFLILDEQYQAKLNGYCLRYDERRGLMYEKEHSCRDRK